MALAPGRDVSNATVPSGTQIVLCIGPPSLDVREHGPDILLCQDLSPRWHADVSRCLGTLRAVDDEGNELAVAVVPRMAPRAMDRHSRDPIGAVRLAMTREAVERINLRSPAHKSIVAWDLAALIAANRQGHTHTEARSYHSRSGPRTS